MIPVIIEAPIIEFRTYLATGRRKIKTMGS